MNNFPLAFMEETSRMQNMENKFTLNDLFDAWPSRKAFADDVGVSDQLVYKWVKAGRIPSGHQAAVCAAADKRGLGFATPAWMLAAHAVEITPHYGFSENGGAV